MAESAWSSIGCMAGLGLLTGLVLFRTKRSELKLEWGRWASIGYRQARRAIILLVGTSVILVGCALLVLPGPAIVVIPLGLAILAIEFAWARRWLRLVKGRAEAVRDRVCNGGNAGTK